MTIQVESELQERFNEAAEAERRPAAQVIRELMRNYVQHVREHACDGDAVDARERERRQEGFDAAVASVTLEGLPVPAAYKSEAARFIRGEIDFAALTEKVHELARDR
jgi:predicted DNA-binding protein